MSSRKKTKKMSRTLKCCRKAKVAGFAVILILLSSTALLLLFRAEQRLTVCTINGHAVTQAELQYYYIEQIASYQDKIRRFDGGEQNGPDFSRPLSQQSCSLTSGISWHEYFMNATLRQLKVQIAGAARAEEEGFTGGAAVEQAVELRLMAIESVAEEAGLSRDEYLRRRYGGQVTVELVREIETRSALCARYLAVSAWELPVSEEEIEARFLENRQWNMTASYLAVPLDCGLEQREQAVETLGKAASQEDFLARCAAYCKENPMERAIQHTDTAAAEMEDYAVMEWALDEVRQGGDITVVNLYDERTDQVSLTALYFLGAQRNDRETFVYQELLLTPVSAEVSGEARYWGTERMNTMDLSSLNEEYFGTLALAYSRLASAGRRGIQVLDAEALIGLPYTEWLTNEKRMPGDVESFKVEYGVYFIRFIGEGGPYWRSNIETALHNEMETALSRELEEEASLEAGRFFAWLTME